MDFQSILKEYYKLKRFKQKGIAIKVTGQPEQDVFELIESTLQTDLRISLLTEMRYILEEYVKNDTLSEELIMATLLRLMELSDDDSIKELTKVNDSTNKPIGIDGDQVSNYVFLHFSGELNQEEFANIEGAFARRFNELKHFPKDQTSFISAVYHDLKGEDSNIEETKVQSVVNLILEFISKSM